MTCETIAYDDLGNQSIIGLNDEILIIVDGQPVQMTVTNFLSSVSGGSSNPEIINLAGAATFDVPAGKLLEHIAIITTSTNTIKIGTTAGGNEIDEESVASGAPYVSSIASYFETLTTIHFTGNGTIKIYLR